VRIDVNVPRCAQLLLLLGNKDSKINEIEAAAIEQASSSALEIARMTAESVSIRNALNCAKVSIFFKKLMMSQSLLG
jgi:hypothetical protein